MAFFSGDVPFDKCFVVTESSLNGRIISVSMVLWFLYPPSEAYSATIINH